MNSRSDWLHRRPPSRRAESAHGPQVGGRFWYRTVVSSSRPSCTLAEWLSSEPFTLTLSSGFFGFYAHTGVLLALEERGLSPRRLTGSSAGALVGGLFAAGLSASEIRDDLQRLERADFWDPSPGLGLLRGSLFAKRLERLLPVRTFGECRLPVSVSVFDVWSRRTKVLKDGELAVALRASCTVPLLFQPVWHEGRPLLDGGILDRPGLLDVERSERVLYHHLASRSPWRRRGSPQLTIPDWPNLMPLVIPDLPRAGPFRMENGARALDAAYAATRAALDSRVPRHDRPDAAPPRQPSELDRRDA